MSWWSHIRTNLARYVAVTLLVVLGTAGAQGHENLLESIALLSERIETTPANARLYLERGELQRLHKAWTLAEADYDRAAALDPTLALVDVARARMLLDAGRPAEALPVITRAIEGEPVAARFIRARVLEELAQPAQAAADYLAAIELSPSPEPDVPLACARAFVAAGDVEQALQVLNRARSGGTTHIALDNAALDLEIKLGRYEDALQRLDRLALHANRKEGWFFRRGEVLEKMNRLNDAKDAYLAARAALEIVPPARRRTAAALQVEAAINAALDRVEALLRS